MLIESLPVGMLQCNCTIVVCSDTRKALVVDPGGDPERIEALLKKHKATPQWVLHSHAHIDHVGATQDVRALEQTCHCGFHQGEQWLLENLELQASFIPMPFKPIEAVDHWLKDGETIKVGTQIELTVCHTPGHTPGSLCFLVAEKSRPQIILSGDTLFAGSIGRTDLWGGDYEAILRSIHQKLLSWPEDIPVIPGHGPATTLQQEKETNPFLTGEMG